MVNVADGPLATVVLGDAKEPAAGELEQTLPPPLLSRKMFEPNVGTGVPPMLSVCVVSSFTNVVGLNVFAAATKVTANAIARNAKTAKIKERAIFFLTLWMDTTLNCFELKEKTRTVRFMGFFSVACESWVAGAVDIQ
jgi:hypothetical protein